MGSELCAATRSPPNASIAMGPRSPRCSALVSRGPTAHTPRIGGLVAAQSSKLKALSRREGRACEQPIEFRQGIKKARPPRPGVQSPETQWLGSQLRKKGYKRNHSLQFSDSGTEHSSFRKRGTIRATFLEDYAKSAAQAGFRPAIACPFITRSLCEQCAECGSARETMCMAARRSASPDFVRKRTKPSL